MARALHTTSSDKKKRKTHKNVLQPFFSYFLLVWWWWWRDGLPVLHAAPPIFFFFFYQFLLLLPPPPTYYAPSVGQEREKERRLTSSNFVSLWLARANASPHVRRTRWRVDESLHQVSPIVKNKFLTKRRRRISSVCFVWRRTKRNLASS